MSSARPPHLLKLSVTTEWETYELQLSPGDTITLGRSPECKIPVPRPTVSQEHLRLTWTGFELQIEDLNSANGTIRMPQESPFVSASFSKKKDALDLKLSKSPVSFSWSVVENPEFQEGNPQATATEVAPKENLKNETGLKLRPHTQISKNKADAEKISPAGELREKTYTHVTQSVAPGTLPLEQPSGPKPAGNLGVSSTRQKITSAERDFAQAAPAKLNKKISDAAVSEKSFIAASWFLAAIPATLIFCSSYFFGKNILQGIAHANSFQLESGGIHDAVLILLALYRQWLGPVLLAPIFTWLISGLCQKIIFKNKPQIIFPLARMFERDQFWGLRKFKLWIGVTALLTATWPILWAMNYGFRVQNLSAYNSFLDLTRQADQKSPEQNIVELKKFTGVFKGSSLLYKHLLFNQRNRIVKECGGVGENAPWPSKKKCLILLQAAATEIFEDVRPALLNDVAQRVATLLSLDGIVRTALVEGRQSEGIGFFLGSLEQIGLASEKFDIEKILTSSEFTNERAISLLRDLRRRIELRLDLRQLELNYPSALYIRVPGPLESGI